MIDTSTEFEIHKAVIDWLNLYPAIRKFVIHIPNEGRRSQNYGKRLQALGMRKGASDLFIALPKRGFHGAWIELKSHKGRLSPDQRKFLDDMAEQDYFTQVCWSLDEAMHTLSWYCL